MSNLMKRRQKNDEMKEIKNSIRKINQLDTENDIQINGENNESFNNKSNYNEDANKFSNDDYVKVIKAENKSKANFQTSYDLSLNSPNFNRQSNTYIPNNNVINQAPVNLSKNNYTKNTYNGYNTSIYNLCKVIDNLSEGLNKDFEEIENYIEGTIDDLKSKPQFNK